MTNNQPLPLAALMAALEHIGITRLDDYDRILITRNSVLHSRGKTPGTEGRIYWHRHVVDLPLEVKPKCTHLLDGRPCPVCDKRPHIT